MGRFDDDDDLFAKPKKFSTSSFLSSSEIKKNLDAVQKLEPEDEPGKDAANPLVSIYERTPHVARRMISFWGTPKLHEYVSGLMLMGRADRAGFPADVMGAILEVLEYIDNNQQASTSTECSWLKDTRLYKSFKKEEIEQKFSHLSGYAAAQLDIAEQQSNQIK